MEVTKINLGSPDEPEMVLKKGSALLYQAAITIGSMQKERSKFSWKRLVGKAGNNNSQDIKELGRSLMAFGLEMQKLKNGGDLSGKPFHALRDKFQILYDKALGYSDDIFILYSTKRQEIVDEASSETRERLGITEITFKELLDFVETGFVDAGLIRPLQKRQSMSQSLK